MYSIRRVEGEALDMEAEERNMQKKISGIITKKCEYLATMHLHTQVRLQLSNLQQFAVSIICQLLMQRFWSDKHENDKFSVQLGVFFWLLFLQGQGQCLIIYLGFRTVISSMHFHLQWLRFRWKWNLNSIYRSNRSVIWNAVLSRRSALVWLKLEYAPIPAFVCVFISFLSELQAIH